MSLPHRRAEIAVLIPCYNEEITIAGVVRDFRKELPGALVCVFDNNSTDASIERARAAGAASDRIIARQTETGSVHRGGFASGESRVW